MRQLKGYHGTDRQSALSLQSGCINVAVGSGELGKGFYLSAQLFVAKAWAWHKHTRSQSVLKVIIIRRQISGFNMVTLSPPWSRVASDFTFGCDVVMGPIVGGYQSLALFSFAVHQGWTPWFPEYPFPPRGGWSRYQCNQSKWESKRAEALLNSTSVQRSIV